MMETSFLPIRPAPPAAAVVRRVRRCRADKARAFIAPGCQVSSCALWRTEYRPQGGQLLYEICFFEFLKNPECHQNTLISHFLVQLEVYMIIICQGTDTDR